MAIAQTDNTADLVSELINKEKKERSQFRDLEKFSRRLKKELVEDSKSIKERKLLVEEIIRGKRPRVDLENIRLKVPKKELKIVRKDILAVEKIVELIKNNMGDEEKIRNEIKVRFSRLSDETGQKLQRIYRHVAGEEMLEKKDLELELKTISVFHIIFAYIQKKSELVKRQIRLIKHKYLKELHNRILDEEYVNDKMIVLVDDVLEIETKENRIEEGKTRAIKPIAPRHTKRNVMIMAALIILAAPFIFKQASNLYGQEPAMSANTEKDMFSDMPEGNIRILTSADVERALQDPALKQKISIKAKQSFIDSLKYLYYFSLSECSVRKCMLDNTAVKALLPENKKLKDSTLSASEISLDGSTLRINSKKPLSAKVPGSKGTATIFLQDSEWSVLESDGDFEFNMIGGRSWLEISLFGRIGGLLKPINKMTNIKRARLFKYKREDRSDGLYGVVYSEESSKDVKGIRERFEEEKDIEIVKEEAGKITYIVKNGVDLENEDFETINEFPEEETMIAQLFSLKQ